MEHPWWGSASGHDRWQNQAIDQLEMELAHQASRHRRAVTAAHERSRRLAGDLAGLAARVDEFIEYTDLRFRQLGFEHVARVRAAVDARFAALAGGGAMPTGELADVAGYWLPPAARGILSRLTGSGAIESDMDTARMRDRLRTELFQLSAGLCFERPDLADEVVPGVLRQPLTLTPGDEPRPGADTEVAVAWRDLWRRVAVGEFGEAAISRLRARLEPAVSELDAGFWGRQIGQRWKTAGEALVGLRQRLTDPDPGGTTAVDDVDRWRGAIQELVAEGFGEERPMLIRLAQIRDGVEDNERPAWQRSAGTVGELLASDLLDATSPPALRRLALSLCADDLVLAVAESAEAANRAVPTERKLRVAGREWVITPETGADVAELERTVRSQYPTASMVPTVVATVVTAALTAVAIPVQPGLAVLCGIALLVSLAVWWNRRETGRRLRDEYQHQLGKSQTQLRKAHDQLVADRRRARDDTARAATEHAALVKLLAPHCTRQPTRS